MKERTSGDESRQIIDLGQIGIDSKQLDVVGDALKQEAAIEKQLQVEQDFEVVQKLLQGCRTRLEVAATHLMLADETKPENIWQRLNGIQVARWRVSRSINPSGNSEVDYDSTLHFQAGQDTELQRFRVVVSDRSQPATDATLASTELNYGSRETKLKVIIPVRGRSTIKVPASTQQILPTPSTLINLVESDFFDDYSRRLELRVHEEVDLILPRVLNRNSPPKILLGTLYGYMTHPTQFLFDPQQSEFRSRESKYVISSADLVQLTREALGLIPTEEVK